MSEPLKTALHNNHVAHGGRILILPVALPVQYESIIKEHQAVRNDVGVFDCSHMGQFFVTGPDAENFVDYMISNNLKKIQEGRGLYTGLLYENGTFVDDIIVYKKSVNDIFMVVNAANVTKDFEWFSNNLDASDFDAQIFNYSDDYSLLLFKDQGTILLDKIFPNFYSSLKTFGHCEISFAGESGFMCRTGYTGGRVDYSKKRCSGPTFEKLIELGARPCGQPRDSLRLEKGFSLYGHEINDKINAIEAGLVGL